MISPTWMVDKTRKGAGLKGLEVGQTMINKSVCVYVCVCVCVSTEFGHVTWTSLEVMHLLLQAPPTATPPKS